MFPFFVDVLMVYPSSLYVSIHLYTQNSGDQLVHLIKDLAGELFTIKTGRPEYQKNYVEPAWNLFIHYWKNHCPQKNGTPRDLNT